MSKLNDILDASVTLCQSLGLQVDGQALTVVKRKLPKKEEEVDLAYQVTVSGAEQLDQARRIGWPNAWWVLYTVEVTLITPNDHDMLHNLADHTAWREATRQAHMNMAANAALGVTRVEIPSGVFLNRAEMAVGYDYNQLVFQVTTQETRP